MATAKDIRSKIGGIKNIQKITNAMQMVAASKMRKSKERMMASRPYSEKILEVMAHLRAAHSQYQHPFMQVRNIKRVGYIVMTTDRGLCGALNINVLKAVLTELRNWQKKGVEQDLCVIGAKAESFFRRVGGNIVAQTSQVNNQTGVKDLIGSLKVLRDLFVEKKIDAVYLCYSKFVNTMVQKPDILQLLPITSFNGEEDAANKKDYWDYIYEPSPEILLDGLLKRYVESEVYQAVVETLACENAARMISMKNATDNAAGLIDDLKLSYNKIRQANITKEITEIVSGAQAISGD